MPEPSSTDGFMRLPAGRGKAGRGQVEKPPTEYGGRDAARDMPSLPGSPLREQRAGERCKWAAARYNAGYAGQETGSGFRGACAIAFKAR